MMSMSVCYVNIPVSSLTFHSTFASERLGHARTRGHAATRRLKTRKQSSPHFFPTSHSRASYASINLAVTTKGVSSSLHHHATMNGCSDISGNESHDFRPVRHLSIMCIVQGIAALCYQCQRCPYVLDFRKQIEND